jgi:hypothetical protein
MGEDTAGAALRILVTIFDRDSSERIWQRRANRERRHSITSRCLGAQPVTGARMGAANAPWSSTSNSSPRDRNCGEQSSGPTCGQTPASSSSLLPFTLTGSNDESGQQRRGTLLAPEKHILKQSEERESAGARPAAKTLRRDRARLPIFAHDLNLLHEPAVSPRKGLRQRN